MCMSHLNIDGANLLLVYKDPRPAYLHPVLFMYEQIWFINSAPRPRASFHRILTVVICQSYLYPKMKHMISNVEQCLGKTDKCEYLWLWFIYLFWLICMWLCSSAHVCVCAHVGHVFLRPHAAVMRDSSTREMCKCGVRQLTAITLKLPTDICSSHKLKTKWIFEIKEIEINSQHHSSQMKNTQK